MVLQYNFLCNNIGEQFRQIRSDGYFGQLSIILPNRWQYVLLFLGTYMTTLIL